MPEDTDLLNQYAQTRSEAAFADFVRRHVDLVYSAAMRRVGGDRNRALEVTQEVFLSAARQAPRLARHPALAAWLHVSTRNAAANLRRAEQRRDHHTQQAQAMHDLQSTPSAAADWTRVRPVLDETLDRLNEREREAVILRFFSGRSYVEIGAVLSLTEDAARKQVGRTLEKLHRLLTQQGVTSSEQALATVLRENAVLVAPAEVAALITRHALVGAGAGGSAALLHLTKATALKIGALTALVAAGVGLVIYRKTPQPETTRPNVAATPAPATKPPVSAAPATTIPVAVAVDNTVDAELAQALAYDQGTKTRRDSRLAAEWYRKAGAHGSAAAEFRLGYLCEVGDGVPQSYQEARSHYERAVALGLPAANLRLGILDLEGWGGPRDVGSAVRRITLAADTGDRPAQRVLSGMYFGGVGVKADLHQALAWQTQAARADDPKAETDVGTILGLLDQQNVNLAREWYQLSAEQDYGNGLLAMASTFLRPGASPEQVNQGRQWLGLAADNGSGSAAFYLAGLELLGSPYASQPDAPKRAKALLEKAREEGEQLAAEVLELAASRPLAAAFQYVVTVPPDQRYLAGAMAAGAQARPDAHGFLPPVLAKMVSPVYPAVFRVTGTEGEVLVDFVVDTTGRPRRIKAVRASHPGFSDAAVLAVENWRFNPAQMKGHAVETHVQVPINFKLSNVANSADPIRCEIQSIRCGRVSGSMVDLRTEVERRSAPVDMPIDADITLKLLSTAPLGVRASRAVVTTAQDETGADLKLPNPSDLYETSVGMVSSEALKAVTLRPLSIRLGLPASDPKALRLLEGRVELVIPDLDPGSTITVPGILATAGTPVHAAALTEEEITLIIYDQQAAEKYRDAKFGEGGPQDYDSGPMFSARAGAAALGDLPPAVVKAIAQQFQKMAVQMKANELAVGISDPHGHLVGVEFRTKDGLPLPYAHNGNYHSSGMPGKPDRRFDVYDLRAPIPPDVQLVCWVATRSSLVTVPFHFTDVPLPLPPSKSQ